MPIALAGALGAALLQPVYAAASEDQAKIRAALNDWTADFNAHRADKVCDLFEPGLIYDFQGLPEQRYGDICSRLKRALTDETRSWTYAQPDIKEITRLRPHRHGTPHLDLDGDGRARGRGQICRARHGHLPPSAGRQLEDHALHGIQPITNSTARHINSGAFYAIMRVT